MTAQYMLISAPTAGVNAKNVFNEVDFLGTGSLTDCTSLLMEALDNDADYMDEHAKTRWFSDGDVFRIAIKYAGRQYQIRYIGSED